MLKFKIGDKVRAIETGAAGNAWPNLVIGQIYTVQKFAGKLDQNIIISERIDIGTKWQDFEVAREFNSVNFELVTLELPEKQFQVGDIVEAFGLKGEVKKIIQDRKNEYPIFVKFESSSQAHFAIDGKYHNWHKEPSLKLIERPVREVTFETEVSFNSYVQHEALNSLVGKQVVVTVKIKE